MKKIELFGLTLLLLFIVLPQPVFSTSWGTPEWSNYWEYYRKNIIGENPLPAVAGVSVNNDNPNILIILADDLGYGDLCSFGNKEYCDLDVTPNLDRLAREGMKFTEFYANSTVCSPTRAALLTGQYPSRFGLRHVCVQPTQIGLPTNTTALPKLIEEKGYDSYHIGKWHLGADNPDFTPQGKGFDNFFGFLFFGETGGSYFNPSLRKNSGSYREYAGHLTDILGNEVVDTIEGAREPFFINYWPYAPHSPVEVDDEGSEHYTDNPNLSNPDYARLVKKLDENVGKILDSLDVQGLADNTIVIFFSDNGGTKANHDRGNGGLRGFKHDLWEGGIKVPMIVRWPGVIEAGSENKDVVMSFDFYPTIAEILSIDIQNQTVDGRSILPLLNGGTDKLPGRNIFWDFNSPIDNRFLYSARTSNGLKLVSVEGETSLFNIIDDPGENIDLSEERKADLISIKKEYNEWKWLTSTIDHVVKNVVGSAEKKENNHFVFPDYGGLVVVQNHTTMNPDRYEFSFSTWIKPTERSTPGTERIVGKAFDWRLHLTRGRKLNLVMHNQNGKAYRIKPEKRLVTNEWNHVAFTMEATDDVLLYLNGELVGSSDYKTIPANKADVTLGNTHKMIHGQGFRGEMYMPQFFNQKLTPDDIKTLMQRTLPL